MRFEIHEDEAFPVYSLERPRPVREPQPHGGYVTRYFADITDEERARYERARDEWDAVQALLAERRRSAEKVRSA